MRLHTITASLVVTLAAPGAMAQTTVLTNPPEALPAPTPGQQDMMRTVHLAARNQLGVLEYCQTQGSIGADVVALQQRLLGMLPPPTVAGEDDAEAMGRSGVVSFAGSSVPMAEAAKSQSSTVDALCKQMASTLLDQAGKLPQ